MNTALRPTAMYEAIQYIAEQERAAEIEAQLKVDAFLDRVSTTAPDLDERQVFEWVNSPEVIACAVIIALGIVVTVCAGWL